MRFADLSCQALQKGCRVKNLHWLVEVCCWGEDEERDREMRSVVVATTPIMYTYDPRKANSESFFKHCMHKILALCKPICLTTKCNKVSIIANVLLSLLKKKTTPETAESILHLPEVTLFLCFL